MKFFGPIALFIVAILIGGASVAFGTIGFIAAVIVVGAAVYGFFKGFFTGKPAA